MKREIGGRDLGATDRRIVAAARAESVLRAPEGFADRVMAVVYREALGGRAAAARSRVSSQTYRRIGLSFVLSAATVAAVLVLPVGSLSMGVRPAATGIVQKAMLGADSLVRGALGSPLASTEGGSRR